MKSWTFFFSSMTKRKREKFIKDRWNGVLVLQPDNERFCVLFQNWFHEIKILINYYLWTTNTLFSVMNWNILKNDKNITDYSIKTIWMNVEMHVG